MKFNLIALFPFLLLSVIVYTGSSCKKGGSGSGNPPVTGPDTTKLHGWIVSTLAGNGYKGNADGDSTMARFSYPSDITQDADGNLFVIDPTNRSIRMITPSGKVTSPFIQNLAGGDTLSDAVTLSTNGHGIFYTIRNSRSIHKITSTGAILFAGGYNTVYKDGQDSSAGFRHIVNVTKDGMGNLYLPDYDASNYTVIRKVSPSGLVSTLPLHDPGTRFFNDGGMIPSIAIDSAGNIYYTGLQSNCIKKLDAQGNVTLVAGSATPGLKDGKGATAQFNMIIGMATDAAGNLWVSDTKNSAVRKVAPDGTVTTIAGNGTTGYVNGDAATALFKNPEAIAVGKNGVVYVVDSGNFTVRKIVYYP